MVMIKGIFLDFYGTLVKEDDSVIDDMIARNFPEPEFKKEDILAKEHQFFSEWIEKSKRGPFYPMRGIAAKSLEQTARHFGVALDIEEELNRLLGYWSSPIPDENLNAFLSGLDVPFYIVSNADDADLSHALESLGIEPQDWITSETARSYKPYAGIFRTMLDRHNLNPAEVIHMGDSYSSDIMGARNLGIRNIWLNWRGKESRGHYHDYEAASLIDALPILQNLSQ